ncbi:MAG: DUF1540 domain-containing protein [Planctomycetota bacterium]
MGMSKVNRCEVTNCAYNHENHCRTIAITIGDADQASPKCDTYMPVGEKGGVSDTDAGVGACKVGSCTYNKQYECSAANILVGMRGQEADCLTFEQR